MIDFREEVKPSGRVLPNILDILPGTELFEKREEYYTNQPTIEYTDITKVQVEMLIGFYMTNFEIDELIRVTPPNIIIE